MVYSNSQILNYLAITMLERIGIEQPSQQQIDSAEKAFSRVFSSETINKLKSEQI